MRSTLSAYVASLLLLTSAARAQNVHINLSTVELHPRSSASDTNFLGVLEVSIEIAEGTEVNATENTLAWNADDLSVFGCEVNEAIDKNLYERHRPDGCIEERDCNELLTLVMTFGPIEPLDDGILLYTCMVGLSAGTASGPVSEARKWTIRCLNPFAYSPDGEPCTRFARQFEKWAASLTH